MYPIPESDIPKYYGDSNSGSAYVLYYQAADIDLVSLGLKSSQPDPLLSLEPHSQSTGIQPRTPSHHSQLAPSLPPGLVPETESTDTENLTPIALPASSPSTNDKPFGSTIGDHNHSLLSNGSPSLPPGAASPLSPGSTGGISGVRRVASSSARPPTATPSLPDKSDRSMHSDSTRSPRHSASSPTLVVPDVTSVIPPVPPLPPSTPTTPTTTAQLNGRTKDKDKDKDKSRKESKTAVLWFKRRSFRLGDKSSKGDKPEKNTNDVPPSPAPKDERSQVGGWLKTASQRKRRPSEAEPFDTTKKAEDRSSDRLEPPQALSTVSSNASSNATHQDSYSSSGPSIVLSSPPTTFSSSSPPVPPKLSISASKSSQPQPNDQVDFPPPRKSSLAPTPRSRGSMDHRRNGPGSHSSFPGPRPATVAGTASVSNGFRQLPPIPGQSAPQATGSLAPIINGTGPLVSEPESIYPLSVNGYGHDTGTSLNTSQSELHSHSHSMSASASSLHASHPPPSSSGLHSNLSSSVTAASPNGSGSSSHGGVNAQFKRAKRKLSLTAPVLGFGRKDKDKEARKEKVSPSSFMQRFDPRT